MKLLCFEMMDMLRGPDAAGQCGGNVGDGGGGEMVKELLGRRADELAGLMADRTQQVRGGVGAGSGVGFWVCWVGTGVDRCSQVCGQMELEPAAV